MKIEFLQLNLLDLRMERVEEEIMIKSYAIGCLELLDNYAEPNTLVDRIFEVRLG